MEEMSAEEMRKAEEMKRVILKKALSKEAVERLNRVKLVKPDLASQLELYLVQLYQNGKIKEELSEQQLITILETITTERRFKFVRK